MNNLIVIRRENYVVSGYIYIVRQLLLKEGYTKNHSRLLS